ncbi:MAG: hypothetical protein MMC23_008449 [Stictis urceolatum]|nr:hypothetical protein [Stictis urceolata]
MDLPAGAYQDTYMGFFDASWVVKGLERWVDGCTFEERGFRERIRFGNGHLHGGLKAGKKGANDEGEAEEPFTFTCPNLIVATGLTSTPHIPRLPGLSKLSTLGRTLHSRDWTPSQYVGGFLGCCRAYLRDVAELMEGKVVLESTTLERDVLVMATGWEPSYLSFFDPEMRRELGLAGP